jgi:hypothetical protein
MRQHKQRTQAVNIIVTARQHKIKRRGWQANAQCYTPLWPPAKKTKPDGSDAAARPYRACPSRLGKRVQLLLVALYMSTSAESPVLSRPPAKNTKPDGRDAAANWDRACPRPLGNRVQLLLVALYMSTYVEYPAPDVHASMKHNPQNRSSISCNQRTQAAIVIVTARQHRTTRRSCQIHAQYYIPP